MAIESVVCTISRMRLGKYRSHRVPLPAPGALYSHHPPPAKADLECGILIGPLVEKGDLVVITAETAGLVIH